MGFFSDLKEDLSQAVNELLQEDEAIKAQPETEPVKETEARKEAETVDFTKSILESEVSLEDLLKDIDKYELPEEDKVSSAAGEAEEWFGTGETKADEVTGDDLLSQWLNEELEKKQNDMIAAEDGEASTEMLSGATAETATDKEAVTATDTETETATDTETITESATETDAGMESTAAETTSTLRFDEEQPEIMAMLNELVQTPESDREWMSDEAGEKMTADTVPEEKIADGEEMEEILDTERVEEKMETRTERIAVDETAVITAGMTITGDITSEGSMDLIGAVNGNIDVYGKLNITGHVNGNSKAAEIYADGAKIYGEVESEGAVKIGASTVIIGNITAASAAIAGAVKGDIDVKGPVILDASAIVMGNIKSKSVQINNGAVIEGMCSQCYADVSPTSFFDEYK